MQEKNVPSRYLTPEKRQELEGYVRSVLQGRAVATTARTKSDWVGTTWRLAFSTEDPADLPRDATVYISFHNEERLDYSLVFSGKTLGLNKLTAECTWEVIDAPQSVSYVYDKIKTDAFGFMNIGIGAFGLLRGRSNQIFTAFFDGTFWIEGAVRQDGSEYINVYVRQETDDWRK